MGSETYLTVRLEDRTELQARIEPDRSICVGEKLWLSIAPEKIHLFDADSGAAIRSG